MLHHKLLLTRNYAKQTLMLSFYFPPYNPTAQLVDLDVHVRILIFLFKLIIISTLNSALT